MGRRPGDFFIIPQNIFPTFSKKLKVRSEVSEMRQVKGADQAVNIMQGFLKKHCNAIIFSLSILFLSDLARLIENLFQKSVTKPFLAIRLESVLFENYERPIRNF